MGLVYSPTVMVDFYGKCIGEYTSPMDPYGLDFLYICKETRDPWRLAIVSQKMFRKGMTCYPSKIEWDLTNGPLRKLLELWDTQV